MLRVRHGVFLAIVAVIGLLLTLIVAFVGSGVREDLTAVYRAELARELELGVWLATSMEDVGPDEFARDMTERIGFRVTVISEEGEVLGDSYVASGDVPEVENHGDRPEVRGALAGELSFATRSSATVGTPFLYGARSAEIAGRSSVLRISASLGDVEESVGRVRRTITVTGLLSMGLALLIGYAFSVTLGRPLTQLAQQARSMAKGDFTGRVTRSSSLREVRDLAGAFNRLAEELQIHVSDLERQRDEIQALIDCMEEGVVALTSDARVFRMNRAAQIMLGIGDEPAYAPIGTLVRHPELRAVLESSVVEPRTDVPVEMGDRHLLASSRRLGLGGAVTTLLEVTELRRLERVRRDFVANASHELRSPLTSIRGFAETLLDDDPPEPLRKQFLSSIRGNAVRLQRLVEDLLDLSRLESGGWVAKREPFEVSAVVREAWGALVRAAEVKDVSLEFHTDASVSGDRQGLVQVLQNLFENSLRHTEEGGRIDVRTEETEDGRVLVTVSDDGEGMSSQALPRIFERFYRADSSRARDAGGTGLGLAIVRHLVQAMGGEVSAQSRLGEGTTIRLLLDKA